MVCFLFARGLNLKGVVQLEGGLAFWDQGGSNCTNIFSV